MANIYFTSIGENGGSQASETAVRINENIATGTIVARIDLPAGDTSTGLNTTIQVVQDRDGRYELWFGNHNGTTAWYLRVKNGGPTLFDCEDEAYGIGGAAHTDITFLMKDAMTGATNHQIAGAVILNDLDEDPVSYRLQPTYRRWRPRAATVISRIHLHGHAHQPERDQCRDLGDYRCQHRCERLPSVERHSDLQRHRDDANDHGDGAQ